jgi:DNA-directed RNA polymerase subunit RPC12/RpoP
VLFTNILYDNFEFIYMFHRILNMEDAKKSDTIDLKTIAEALGAIDEVTTSEVRIKTCTDTATATTIVQAGTKHKDKCPECGGRVMIEERSEVKANMTVYGRSGVRHVRHVAHRCAEKHCRTGLYHGYRILKGGQKVFEDDCLYPSHGFLGSFDSIKYGGCLNFYFIFSRKPQDCI